MNKLRILLVGSDKVWSLERIYLKHLEELGVEVRLFAAQNIFYEYYGSGLINKLLFRTGFSSIYKKINQSLFQEVDNFSPDWILVFKGMEILPETLNQLREKGIRLANYNPDSPFLFSGRGSGNKNITNSIKLYDLHFSYDRAIQHRISTEYKIPCIRLPFGFELSESQYLKCLDEPEQSKVCFLGNPDKDRVIFLTALADDVLIDVYGHGWEKHIQHPKIKCLPAVFGDDFWKTLYRYRVQLNLMRPHNPASHNMRSFEIPAVGGIGLYPNTIDHLEYFQEKGIAYTYSNLDECKLMCAKLLAMNKTESDYFRKRAREQSVQLGYSYASRTKQVYDAIKDIVK
jgi:spore maturation protein CgeB